MELPVENMPEHMRLRARAEMERELQALPRATTTEIFLADLAASVTKTETGLEDALLWTKLLPVTAAGQAQKTTVVQGI